MDILPQKNCRTDSRDTCIGEARNDQSDRLDLGIEDNCINVVVGEVVLNEYDKATLSNFRILIGPKGRDRIRNRSHN